jgi:hypothetical protein
VSTDIFFTEDTLTFPSPNTAVDSTDLQLIKTAAIKIKKNKYIRFIALYLLFMLFIRELD